MIKVGDYAKYKNDILIVKKTYMYSFVGLSLTHATEHVLDYDNDVSWLVDYEDYEQQKQRADELEKRWEKLKTLLDRLWKFGDADTHEVAYDLLIRIKQIEEDGE